MTAKLTKAQQAAVDKTIADALAEAKAQMVQATSKPQLVSNLRSTWRKSAQHTAEQIARFVRLTLMAAVPPVIDLIAKGTSHFDWYTLLMIVVPVGETAWRQVFPALGAAKVDEAPGVTIVPEQVGAPDDPAPEGDAAP